MERAVPSVIYDRSLNDSDVAYQITVNRQKIGRFLQQMGVPRNELLNTEIVVKKSSRSERASFERLGGRNILNIVADDTWEEYEDAMEQVMKLSYGISNEETDFEDLLYTKRLRNYLKKVPAPRGLQFASRLLLNAANRELNSNFFHEIRHLVDSTSEKFRLWFRFGRIIDLLPLLDRFDPAEKSANEFESQYKNHLEWKDLITIKPKKTA